MYAVKSKRESTVFREQKAKNTLMKRDNFVDQKSELQKRGRHGDGPEEEHKVSKYCDSAI